MTIQKYSIQLAVTIAAFLLGLAAVGASRSSADGLRPMPAAEFETPSNTDVTHEAKIPVVVSSVPSIDAASTEVNYFDYSNHTGEYYISHEDLPRDFKDIDHIAIVTHEYDERAARTTRGNRSQQQGSFKPNGNISFLLCLLATGS